MAVFVCPHLSIDLKRWPGPFHPHTQVALGQKMEASHATQMEAIHAVDAKFELVLQLLQVTMVVVQQ